MPQPQVGKRRQQATEKAKTGLIATPKYGAGDLQPTHFRLPEKRDRIMKPIILKLICAAITATALAAKQYEEMDDYQVMRGVVYEPAGEQP